MRNSYLGALIGMVLAAAALPAAAQSSSRKPEIVVKGEQIDPADRVVCKSDVPTGSIMPHRVCKTQGQIDREREKSLIAAEQLRQDFESQRLVHEICGTAGKSGCVLAP